MKEGYFLAFSDEFKTDYLDTSKWVPYYLPQWSSREKSKANFKIENDQLKLIIDEKTQPWCPEFNGDVKCSSLQTGLYAGPVNSQQGQHRFSEKCVVREEQKILQHYTPTYGYFEIRAKALATKNVVCAFWMIGFEEHPNQSAEICIMEIKGNNIEGNRAVNGYGVHPFGDPTIKDAFFETPMTFDPTLFNVYAAEWKPDVIDFYLNGKLINRVYQTIDYPMQFMLNIYEVPIKEELGVEELRYPKEFVIDYVRTYQPVTGY